MAGRPLCRPAQLIKELLLSFLDKLFLCGAYAAVFRIVFRGLSVLVSGRFGQVEPSLRRLGPGFTRAVFRRRSSVPVKGSVRRLSHIPAKAAILRHILPAAEAAGHTAMTAAKAVIGEAFHRYLL